MTKNIKRFLKISFIVFILFLVGYIGYKFMSFNLLEVKTNKLNTINVVGKSYKITLYHINGNATVQGGIQVRLAQGAKEKTLKHYDRYNFISFYLVDKGTLKLGLRDTTFKREIIDTVYLKLP